MLYFVIHAYEGIYQGLHGMEEWILEDFNDKGEAKDYACEQSLKIMNSYYQIMDDLQETANFDMSDLDDVMKENIEYELFQVEDIFCECHRIKRTEKLFNEDPLMFVENFCKKV